MAAASASTVTGVSTTRSNASSTAPSSASASSGGSATSMPRSRSVTSPLTPFAGCARPSSAGWENSSVMIRLFHRLSGFGLIAGRLVSGPRNLQHTKRFCLVECYRPAPVELEQCQEPADDQDRLTAVGNKLGEGGPMARPAALQFGE